MLRNHFLFKTHWSVDIAERMLEEHAVHGCRDPDIGRADSHQSGWWINPLNLDDADIMERVQEGELSLFDELVHRYREPLLRAAWSKLGDAAWSEDVVQEAFLAAFAARHTYRSAFSFRTWMWTILLNLCRKQWKRKAGRREVSSVDWGRSRRQVNGDTTIQEPAVHETGLTHLLTTERQEIVAKMLGRLPEPQADALRLRFFGELKFEEIADVMDSSLSAAKVRVKQGLKGLAELFRQAEEDPL